MKLFQEDFDPFSKSFQENSQLKNLVLNRLRLILVKFKFRTSRLLGDVFSWARRKDWSSLRTVSIVVLLTISILFLGAGNSIEGGSTNIEISKDEIKKVASSVDKYTYLINEHGLSHNGRKPLESLITSIGDITQPEGVLVNSVRTDIIDLGGPKDRDQLIDRYQVKKNDTLSAISNKFNINTNTILWANNLKKGQYIVPGQKLIIPKRNGVWHTVKKEERIKELVKKYHANLEKTLEFNGLKKDEKLADGAKVLAVGGEKEILSVNPNPSSPTMVTATPTGKISTGSSDYNTFPYGWCTWYVASKRNIPWIGNARDWLPNSRAMGYATGMTPKVGSIMVLNESWWGHVALVESVNGNQVIISEMNAIAGWGRVNNRTMTTSNPNIMGYIY